MNENTFGKLLRYYRRSSQDKLNGGNLSQDRLADLLAEESGIVYSRGAISDWERGKGQIHKDTRDILVSLINIFHTAGGIQTLEDANHWLESGNYRQLNNEEIQLVSAEWLHAILTPTTTDSIFTAPLLPPHDVIGRDELLDSLKSQLFAGHNLALSALNGLPGVGKTTLAILLAHDPEIQEQFSDGVLWVGLGGDPDVFHQLGQWGTAVGIPNTDLEKMGALKLRANAIHEQLKNKKMLLVIDDVWNRDVIPLFKLGGDECIHVLTTRQPPIAVEFAGDNTLSVPELSEKFAFELLRQLAPQIVANESEAAWEIVRMTGGLPLALVLIGNYLRIYEATGRKRRIQSALGKINQLENRFEIERAQSVIDSEAHPSLPHDTPISLKSIIGASEQALSPKAKNILQALSLFPPKPNTFSEEAILFVSEATPEELDELSDHGLLESTDMERYSLHQSISDFAQLQPTNPKHKERFVGFYQQFTEENIQNHQAINLDLDNITNALAIAKSIDQLDLLWRLLDELFPFFEAKGHYEIEVEYLEFLKTQNLSYAVKGRIYLHLGRIAFNRNQNDQASSYWLKGLQLTRSEEAHNESLELLSNLSIITSQNGDYESSESYLEEAVQIANSASNWFELSRALANLGRLAFIKDRYLDADEYLAQSLQLATQYEHFTIVCSVYNMLGLVEMNLGNFDLAINHYFNGLQTARAHRFNNRILILLTNLGHLLCQTEKFDDAKVYLEEGLELARHFNDRSKEAHILMDLGNVHTGQSNIIIANDYMSEGYSVAESIDNKWLMGQIKAYWGHTCIESKNYNDAKMHFKVALAWAGKSSTSAETIGLAEFGLAKLAFQLNNITKSRVHIKQGLDALNESGHILTKQLTAWKEKHLKN